jgi:hypothetical protein
MCQKAPHKLSWLKSSRLHERMELLNFTRKYSIKGEKLVNLIKFWDLTRSWKEHSKIEILNI